MPFRSDLLEGPVSLKRILESKLSTREEEGFLAWNDDRKVPTWFDGEDYEYPIVGDDVLTSTQTVQDTTAHEEVFSADIDAGSMVEGRAYEIVLLGAYSTVNNSDTFDLQVHIGGNTVATVTSVASNETDAPITLTFYGTVRSAGQNGSMVSHVDAVFDNVHQDAHAPVPITVDTTTSTTFSAHVEWSAADPDNHVDIVQGYMKEIS